MKTSPPRLRIGDWVHGLQRIPVGQIVEIDPRPDGNYEYDVDCGGVLGTMRLSEASLTKTFAPTQDMARDEKDG